MNTKDNSLIRIVLALVVAALIGVGFVSCRAAVKDKPADAPAPSLRPGEPPSPLPEIGQRLKISFPLKKARIEVDKKQRKLMLYEGGTLLKTYPIALGFEPEGHKKISGDGKTPEGAYYMIKHTSPAFGRCFYIAYPNADDAKAGLDSRLINKKQYDRILKQLKNLDYPAYETGLGGQILLHGTKDRSKQHLTDTDWTFGCIAMENEHILELLDAIPDNARIVINIMAGEKQKN